MSDKFVSHDNLGTVLSKLSTKITNKLKSYALKDELSTVATSGSYADLSEKPILSKVATSGNYEDLKDKPIQLSTDNFVNSSNYEIDKNNLENKIDTVKKTILGFEDTDEIKPTYQTIKDLDENKTETIIISCDQYNYLSPFITDPIYNYTLSDSEQGQDVVTQVLNNLNKNILLETGISKKQIIHLFSNGFGYFDSTAFIGTDFNFLQQFILYYKIVTLNDNIITIYTNQIYPLPSTSEREEEINNE